MSVRGVRGRRGDDAEQGIVPEGGPRRAARARGRSRATPVALVLATMATVLAVPLLAVGPGVRADAAPATGSIRPSAPVRAEPTAAAEPPHGARSVTTADPTSAPAPTPSASPGPGDATPAPGDGTPQDGTRPTGTPTAPPSGSPVVDPTIHDPGDLTTALARVHGAATPGHTVRVQVGADGSTMCSAPVGADGRWACTGPVRSGPGQVFAATDLDDPSLGTALSPASDIVTPPTVSTTGTTSGLLVGDAVPGADVTVSVSGSSTARTTTADAQGRWRATLAGVPDGPVTVSTSQLVDTALGYRSELRSSGSAPVTVLFDRTPPAAPVITAPSDGSTVGSATLRISGTATTGDTVTVYADRTARCRVEVLRGRWSCSVAVAALRSDERGDADGDAGSASDGRARVDDADAVPGGVAHPRVDTGGGPGPGTTSSRGALGSTEVRLTALAVDHVGNHSPASSVVRVTLTDGSSGSATPGATAPGSGSSSPTGPHGRAGDHSPGSSPTGGAVGGGTGSGGSGAAGSTSGGSSAGAHPGARADWSLATDFDAAVPDIRSVVSWRTAVLAAVVAAGFLALVVLPLGLVLGRSDGATTSSRLRLTGRNRPRAETSRTEAVLPGWAAAAVSVVLASVLVLLATGVAVEARYARLAIAVLVGSAALTAVSVVTTRWAAGADRHRLAYRLSPWLVGAAVAAAALTRIADLSPAVVIGVLLVPVLRPSPTAPPAGLLVRCATWRSTGLLLVAVGGWVVHSAVAGSGPWGTLVAETAITCCVGGVGALLAGLVPVAASPAAALWAASRGRFVVLAAAGCTLAAAVSSGPSGQHVSPVPVVAAATLCAAVCGVVLWHRRRQGRPTV